VEALYQAVRLVPIPWAGLPLVLSAPLAVIATAPPAVPFLALPVTMPPLVRSRARTFQRDITQPLLVLRPRPYVRPAGILQEGLSRLQVAQFALPALHADHKEWPHRPSANQGNTKRQQAGLRLLVLLAPRARNAHQPQPHLSSAQLANIP
jgi:hypothetical protein